MTRYIQGKDGKFAGSVGTGKDQVPVPSDVPRSTNTAEAVAEAIQLEAMLAATRSVTPSESYAAGKDLTDVATLITAKHGLPAKEAERLLAEVTAERPPLDPAANRPLDPVVATALISQTLTAGGSGKDVAADELRDTATDRIVNGYKSARRSLTEWEAGVLLEIDKRALGSSVAQQQPTPLPSVTGGATAGYLPSLENRRCTVCGQFISTRESHGPDECAKEVRAADPHANPVNNQCEEWSEQITKATFARWENRHSKVLDEDAKSWVRVPRHSRKLLEQHSDEELADMWVADSREYELRSVAGHVLGMYVARHGEERWPISPRLRAAMIDFPEASTVGVVARHIDPPYTPEEVGRLLTRIPDERDADGMLAAILKEPRTASAAHAFISNYPLPEHLRRRIREGWAGAQLSPELLAAMSTSGDPEVRATAASAENLPPSIAAELAQDSDPAIRLALAMNKRAVAEVARENVDALVPLVNDRDHARELFWSLAQIEYTRGTYSYWDKCGLNGQHVYLASRMSPERLADMKKWLVDPEAVFDRYEGHYSPSNVAAHRSALDRILALV